MRLFVNQISAFRRVLRAVGVADRADTQLSLAIGECLATIVYGQLIAENAQRLHVADSLVSVIFDLLVHDLNAEPPQHDHPWQGEAFGAVHGGLWRAPYEPRSALGLSAVLGYAGGRG